jgi:hypothetical protein
MRSARKCDTARRWRPREQCGEPGSGSWRAWRPLREAKARTWSDRYRESCESESTRPTGWGSPAKAAKPAKMKATKSNQALEPTETRVSVFDVAALISPVVSGLRGSVPRSTLQVRMRSARKCDTARRWRPREQCGEPGSGSWRAWRPLREAKARTWSDRYRESCESESTRPTGWGSPAKAAKPAKMKATKSNQALEPTETRVSVFDVAALISPVVSGLRSSVPR